MLELKKCRMGMDIRKIVCLLILNIYIFRSTLGECHFSRYTDINSYSEIIWNCSNEGLQEIHELPNFPKNVTVALDLSFNRFQIINESIINIRHGREKVTSLLLHHNKILAIHEGSFVGFPNLKRLNLASCSLQNSHIHENAFLNLANLKELTVDDNTFQRTGYPSLEISHLTELQKLHIDVFEGFMFDNHFKSLKRLSEIIFNPQGIFHLRNISFQGLSECPIEYLSFDFDGYVYCDISEDIFCSFPFLKGLKMNIGSLCNFTRALRSLKCLQNRTIDYIDVGNNIPDNTADNPPQFSDWAIEYLKNICIKNLNIYSNSITYISFSFFGTNMQKCIEQLDLSENQGCNADKSIAFFYEFPKLKFLNISRISYFSLRFQEKYLQYNEKPNLTFHLPSTIETLDCSYNYIHSHVVESLSQVTVKGTGLKHLYLTDTYDICQLVTILDFPSLEYLDISGCTFNKVRPLFFQRLGRLRTLYARKTWQIIKLSDEMKANFFVSQKHLSFLDLSENSLADLFFSIFRFQRKCLKTLILDDNIFQTIPKALDQLQSLSILSLKGNKLKIISDTDIDILAKMHNIRTDIRGNLITCSCSAEESLKQINENIQFFTGLDDLHCVSDDRFRNFQLSCISSFWLKFSVTTLLISIIIIIMVMVIYRNRVIVDYVLLRLRLSIKRQNYIKDEDHFSFDVFISYSGYDHDWVTSTLYNKLAEFGFQVCLHHKDFIPGNCISEEIVKYIDKSRKVLFLVTENFLKSSWTSYEVQIAKQHAFRKNRESMIIILMKDNIPIARMPGELRNFWWKVVCAKWPQQECEKELDIFWESLKKSIEG